EFMAGCPRFRHAGRPVNAAVARATFSRAWKLAADMVVSHIPFRSEGRVDDANLMSSIRAIWDRLLRAGGARPERDPPGNQREFDMSDLDRNYNSPFGRRARPSHASTTARCPPPHMLPTD